jgi:hypothetical protein
MPNIARKVAALVFIVAACTVTSPAAAARAPQSPSNPNGITITPAALSLTLAKGQKETSTSFGITNRYPVAVTLQLQFERSQQQLQAKDPRPQLSMSHRTLSIAPGETAQEAITLRDSNDFAPGSQLVDLVITQQSSAGQGVGILPSVRLPISLIKIEGAITSLNVQTISGGGAAMSLPSTVAVTIRNTGNMVAIPHGTVTIMAPGGKIVGKGALNVASRAISPDAEQTLQTPITSLGAGILPGNYRIAVSYGLGGDTGSETAITSLLYAAWWHIAVLLGIGAAAWYVIRHTAILSRTRAWTSWKRKPPAAAPPKRHLLIGRDIT